MIYSKYLHTVHAQAKQCTKLESPRLEISAGHLSLERQLWRSRCFMLIGKSCCRGARIVGAENPQRLESEPNISFASRKMSISGCICVALVEMSSLL